MLTVSNSSIDCSGLFLTGGNVAKGTIVNDMNGRKMNSFQTIFNILTGKVRYDDPLQIGKTNYIFLNDISVKINHSCDPNCALATDDKLIAIRDIKMGEEITFDYSTTVWPNLFTRNWEMKCLCGAKNCRKVIKNIKSLDKNHLKDLVENNKVNEAMKQYIIKKMI